MMTKYHLHLIQNRIMVAIEIRDRPAKEISGAISAKKYGYDPINLADDTLQPAIVDFNVHFNRCLPEQAEKYLEWQKLAIQAARRLDDLIKTREDLGRPLNVRMAKKSVLIDFADTVN